MQAVSNAYKKHMKEKLRNRTYVRVTVGLINQQAQADAFVPGRESYTYYSNLKRPLDNYQVEELYAACDQDYTTVDGGMYFLPRERQDVVLNQGIVSESILGGIEVHFPIPYDIKGLTVEFGKAYPVNFMIESDSGTVEITGNASGHFVTEEIFIGATFLRFVPLAMINGQSRLRIHMLTMGIGIYFDNRNILTATKKEHISPVMEELPSIDFDLTIDNKNRAYDIENEESTVNFFEIGQSVDVIYGQELEDGLVEWMPGASLSLKEWSTDDEEMSFSASDRFDTMNDTYYGGMYYPEGISLYDMAVDVFRDSGTDSRTYWLDPYLKNVLVKNPMPAVTHKEALQIIANAGRCILYQDRSGDIFLKSSFIPDMDSVSDNETYYSHAGNILDKTDKDVYAAVAHDYTDVTPTQYFMLRQTADAAYLNTGYISQAVADAEGNFTVNPTVEITLEAAYKCFGMTMEFGRIPPAAVTMHIYLDGVLQEDFPVTELETVTIINHEFPEWDRMVLEFTRHRRKAAEEGIYLIDSTGNYLTDGEGIFLTIPDLARTAGGTLGYRVVLDNVVFGDSTDYELSYGRELTETPKGTQLAKVKQLQIVRTMYEQGIEYKTLTKESISITESDNRYTIYFSNPSHGYSVSIVDAAVAQSVSIVDSSAYYVTVALSGVAGPVEVEVKGYEYMITHALVNRQLNPTGRMETWENPLVSDIIHAADLADWVGDYMRADREYDLKYRGEPRIDANDIVFLENRYVQDLLVRIYEHTLKFNGALSGTIKARRDMGDTVARRR